MPAKIDPEKCTGCGSCVDICPTEAIKLNDDGKAEVDPEKCGDCGACVDECPSEAITLSE